jgi:S-methylmethionine-dependent homocysteine/selenocysteine methylase
MASTKQNPGFPTLMSVLHSLPETGKIFLMDGGTGEELFRRGLPDDRKLWSASAVVRSEFHETLQQVHTAFLDAGSQAITTNSYGIVPGVGFEDVKERQQYIAMAGEIARRAVEGHKKQAYVLGSLGPLIESYRPDLIRSHELGVEDYRVACEALKPYVDAFLAETMSCCEESLQALEAAASFDRPCLVSYTLDSLGNLRDGQAVTDCLTELLDYCETIGIECKWILTSYWRELIRGYPHDFIRCYGSIGSNVQLLRAGSFDDCSRPNQS